MNASFQPQGSTSLVLQRAGRALAALAFAGLASAAVAAPVQLAARAPVAGFLAGDQSDQAVPPLARPVSSFSSVAAAVTSVQWWGYDLAGLGGPDQFVVKINGSTLSGTVTTLVNPPEIDAGVDVLRYSLELSSAFNLAAGVASLSIVNDTDQVEWYWQASADPSAPPLYSFAVFGELASQPVPEPGALALVALGLALMWAGRRPALS